MGQKIMEFPLPRGLNPGSLSRDDLAPGFTLLVNQAQIFRDIDMTHGRDVHAVFLVATVNAKVELSNHPHRIGSRHIAVRSGFSLGQ